MFSGARCTATYPDLDRILGACGLGLWATIFLKSRIVFLCLESLPQERPAGVAGGPTELSSELGKASALTLFGGAVPC